MPTLTDLPQELLELVASNVYNPLQVSEESLLLGTGIFAPPNRDSVRSLKNLSRTCRYVNKAVRPLLYRNIEISGYVPTARILECNWRWRHKVKVLRLCLDFPRRLPDEATWLAFTAGMLFRLLTNFPHLEHLCLKLVTDDSHKLLVALTNRLKGSVAYNDAAGLTSRLKSLGLECHEDKRPDTVLQDLQALAPFVARFPNLDFLFISADHQARSPPVLPILENVRSPLRALTVIGLFRDHCVPLLGAIAEKFGGLQQLIIRGCERFMQEPIFKVHAAPALRQLNNLRIFKVSCPGFNGEHFRTMVTRVAPLLPSLLVMGLEDVDDTWGIWRDGKVTVRHFEPGHLTQLQQVLV